MRTWWSHHPRTRSLTRPRAHGLEPVWNDLRHFSFPQIEWLATRGLVFLTEVTPCTGCFGAIVAASFDEACRIAKRRHLSERVLGLMQPSFLKRDWCQLQSPRPDARAHSQNHTHAW